MAVIEVLEDKFESMVAGSGDWGVPRNQECQSQPVKLVQNFRQVQRSKS